MPDNANRLRELLEAYTKNEIGEAGFKELCELLKVVNDNELKEIFESGLRNAPFNKMDQQKLDKMLKQIVNNPSGTEPHFFKEEDIETPGIQRMFSFRKITVAASIILMIGIGIFLLFFNKTEKQKEIVKAMSADVEAPKNSKAVIILADGRKVSLDSVNSGTLATQGNVDIVKTGDGKIVYHGSSNEIFYNTLFNPRGGKIESLTLSEGTKVWLNSESSLRFPTTFTGNERKVEIKGEAYFEVAHNTAMPFKVQKDELQVTVLGTHFNINAYDDEAAIKVTLLNGLVKVNRGNAAGLLKPGQQARITSDLEIADDVNMEEVMAWKNGKFQFGDAADISIIMKQISRWYDVDVEYKGTIKDHIGGTISRDVNVSQVFKMLEMTGVVTFQIDGKKVIVMPK